MVWLQATYSPVFGADGDEVRKVVKIADDVTDQVRVEQKLSEREEMLSERSETLLAAMDRFADGDLTAEVDETGVEGTMGRLFEGFRTCLAD